MRWCLSLAPWNGRDEILKEQLFGLSNEQGNHGEDVKRSIIIWMQRRRTPIRRWSIAIRRMNFLTMNWSASTASVRGSSGNTKSPIPEYLPMIDFSM